MIIKINKSYILGGLGFALALLAIVAILLSSFTLVLKILVPPVLLLVTYLQVQRVALLKADHSIVALGLGDSSGEGGMDVYLGANHGEPVPCRVVRSHVSKSLVTAQLTAVTGNQNHELFLVRPMCSRQEFRILKRFLLSLKNPLAN